MAPARAGAARPARRAAAADGPDRRGARPRALRRRQAALLRARPDGALPERADRGARARPGRAAVARVVLVGRPRARLEPAERFLLALAILTGFDSARGERRRGVPERRRRHAADARARPAAVGRPGRAARPPPTPAAGCTVTACSRAGPRLDGARLARRRWSRPRSSCASSCSRRSDRRRCCGRSTGERRTPSAAPGSLAVVPVVGPARRRARRGGRRVPAPGRLSTPSTARRTRSRRPGLLEALACNCWLRGVDLFLDLDAAAAVLAARPPALPEPRAAAAAAAWPSSRPRAWPRCRQALRLPAVHVPQLTYEARLELWRRELGVRRELDPALRTLARRFRFEAGADPRRSARASRRDGAVTRRAARAAECRAELEHELGELAEEVRAALPAATSSCCRTSSRSSSTRSAAAMASLVGRPPRVGHRPRPGTRRASRCSSPARPAPARRWRPRCWRASSTCRCYRVDLSQVVNKYIGETEKNLRRVFDACEASDLIVLFDEADALFGRRTQVPRRARPLRQPRGQLPAERMERFKGLTILATNRKEDLDEAFLRRLRYVVDFPLPGVAERRGSGTVAIPGEVDASELDLDFLAERVPAHRRPHPLGRLQRLPAERRRRRRAPAAARWRTCSSPCAASSTRPSARSASSGSAVTPTSCAASRSGARMSRVRIDRVEVRVHGARPRRAPARALAARSCAAQLPAGAPTAAASSGRASPRPARAGRRATSAAAHGRRRGGRRRKPGGAAMSLLLGALIEYGTDFLGPLPNVVVFQFNPEQVTRTIEVPQRPTGAGSRETSQAGEVPLEKIDLNAEFSAADMLAAEQVAGAHHRDRLLPRRARADGQRQGRRGRPDRRGDRRDRRRLLGGGAASRHAADSARDVPAPDLHLGPHARAAGDDRVDDDHRDAVRLPAQPDRGRGRTSA